MKSEFRKMTFSRALLAGVLCGIVTAIFIAGYAGIYRNETDFEKLAGINPTIIFAFVPLVTVIAAVIYYLLVHYFGKGEVFFETVFIVLMLIAVAKDIRFHRSVGETLMTTANGFLFGLEIITGLAICIFLPYLAHHPKIYMTNDELKWE